MNLRAVLVIAAIFGLFIALITWMSNSVHEEVQTYTASCEKRTCPAPSKPALLHFVEEQDVCVCIPAEGLYP